MVKLIIISFVVFILYCLDNFSQTIPKAFVLNDSNYKFTYWDENSQAGTYPQSMALWQTKIKDAKLEDSLDSDWVLPYNLSSKSRINGVNDDGLVFVNTSLANDSAAFNGAAVIAINTNNCKNIRINWKCYIKIPGEREYSIELLFKTKNDKDFIRTSQIFRSSNPDSMYQYFSYILPDSLNNREDVLLCWRYYYSGIEDAGSRPQLGIDEINIIRDITDVLDNQPKDIKFWINKYKIYIESVEECIIEVQIYDYLGRRVFVAENFQLFAGNNEINLPSMANNCYFVIVRKVNYIFFEKLIEY